MIDPVRFRHQARDPWRWRAAMGPDVPVMVDLAVRNYESDATGQTEINPVEGSRNLMSAVVNQMYNPKTDLLTVVERSSDHKILGFTWTVRGVRNPWSTEEMVVPKMMSLELGLSVRTRTALAVQALYLWERWAHVCEIRCISSCTTRRDWRAYMHLHARMGYDVRGSIAVKRLNTITYAVDNQQQVPRIVLP